METTDEQVTNTEAAGTQKNVATADENISSVAAPEVAAQPMTFSELQAEKTEGKATHLPSFDMILDISVTLSVELGKTKISIRELLQLNHGSVVELDRLAGEPLDVMVNGTLIARGEVVVIDKKFGVRLTHVVSTEERIEKLG